MKRVWIFIALAIVVSGCASTPKNIGNACAIFDQKDGYFNNWEKAAKNAELKYGIPMPIIMATMYTESGFQQNAKPRRTKLLGFIPWKRLSSANGYSQALEGTWDHYRRATGNFAASRTKFSDAADFIGWYDRQSVIRNAINPNDAYNLYLNYHMGHTAYSRANGQYSAAVRQAALRTDRMARIYDQQLRNCGRR